MFKKVSCCPAKEASGKSSAVAEERTATAMSGLPFESLQMLYELLVLVLP
jgi:hypothetical protein